MNKKILLSIIAVIVTWAVVSSITNNTDDEFKLWVSRHGKKYPGDEFSYRLNIFKQTLKQIK